MTDEADEDEYTQRLPSIHEAPPDKLRQAEHWPDGSALFKDTVDKKAYTSYRHASGSMIELRNDGSAVVHAANNFVLYGKGGTTITMDNHGDLKVHGHLRVNVDTDAHIVFGKNLSFAVGGMLDIYSGGHTKIAATDIALQSTAGSIVQNAERDVEMRAENGRVGVHSNGVTTFTTNKGDFHIDSPGKIQMSADMNVEITSRGAEINTQSAKDTNIKSSSKVYTKAPMIEEDGDMHLLEKDADSFVEGKDLDLSAKVKIKKAGEDTN